MPRRLSRLVAVVALLAFLAGNGSAICHARSVVPCCACGHDAAEGAERPSGEPGQSAAPAPCSHDNDLPSCPCPGGCAFCSVAKVPGLCPLTLPAAVTPSADGSPDESPPIYDPPSRGTPTRPPRS